MAVMDKMWDALTTVIKMNDKVERLAGTVKTQQDRIERLTERLIRVEAMLELALAAKNIPIPTDGNTEKPTLRIKKQKKETESLPEFIEPTK